MSASISSDDAKRLQGVMRIRVIIPEFATSTNLKSMAKTEKQKMLGGEI